LRAHLVELSKLTEDLKAQIQKLKEAEQTIEVHVPSLEGN
jgi:hypothetical protein